MTSLLNTRVVFLASINRCAESPTFVPEFYERFMSMSPVVRLKFAHTDFDEHAPRLLRSLRTMASAISGEAEGLHELAARAETHNRHHLNITIDLYEIWVKAIVTTAREHDPLWDAQVAAAWTQSLKILVKYMVKRY